MSNSSPNVALAHGSHDRHDLEVDSTTASGKPRFFSRIKVLGQAQKTFLVCEGSDALHVIDPRAAHGRVSYERIKSGHHAAGLAQQQLLLPMQLDLTARESAAAQEHRDLIGRLGFDLEPFGGSTWQVMAVPALLGGANLERLIRDVLAELSDLGTTTVVEARLDSLFLGPRLSARKVRLSSRWLSSQAAVMNSTRRLQASSANHSVSVRGTKPSSSAGKVV